MQENVAEINAAAASSKFINAFQIIAMSSDLDLSGLFEENVKDLKLFLLKSLNSSNKELKIGVFTYCYVFRMIRDIKQELGPRTQHKKQSRRLKLRQLMLAYQLKE